MNKILYFNFNVGSAIEQSGNIFSDWIGEITKNIYTIKNQNRPVSIIDDIININPNIIILNEYFENSAQPTFYYKKFNHVRILHIEHIWKRFLCNDTGSDTIKNDSHFRKKYYQNIDNIFCINQMPNIKHNISTPIRNFYYPTNPNMFNISIPWSERTKDFLYIGNILPHKLSEEFIDKISNTDIVIDCVGKKFQNKFPEYTDKISNSKNFNILDTIPFENVASVMNQYKYFIMPHNGYEPFNWTLLQCIFCGTIPLIINDSNSKEFDSTWIDWAQGLYFGTNTVDEMIDNMIELLSKSPDFSENSEFISNTAQKKFDYDAFKNMFQSTIKSYLEA